MLASGIPESPRREVKEEMPPFMSEDSGDGVFRNFEKGLEISGKKGRLISARMIKNACIQFL
jgi:hypothetical protein